MIIAGATIGAVSFGIQAYNSWRNEVNAKKIQESQEAFQRAALEENFEFTMEQFHKMQEAKRQIMAEERDERISMMRDMHQENLKAIAYLTSLDKWPLAVMPLVMRDDNLFGFSDSEAETITPINVIMGPCLDRNFQTRIWKSVEEELSMRFSAFWSITSHHPIIFYQDGWKDDHDPADSSQCANIHASIRNVPTIIFSPVITKRGLQIEMTHWCVTGMDADKSYQREVRLSLEASCHHYQPREDYEGQDVEALVNELADVLESLIGYMNDQYIWCRYSVVPICPQMLSSRFVLTKETVDNLYTQYVAMLQSSLINSQLNAVDDLEVILQYCGVVDRFGQSDKAFQVVCKAFLGDNLLTDPRQGVPAYETEKLKTFLQYCQSHLNEIEMSSKFYEGLRYSIALENLYRQTKENLIADGSLTDYVRAKFYVDEDGQKVFDLQSEYTCLAENTCQDLVERCGSETEPSADRRNWVRPKFFNQLKTDFNEKISTLLIDYGEKSSLYKQEVALGCLSQTLSALEGDTLLGFEASEKEQAEAECSNRILEFATRTGNNVAADFWHTTYISDSVDRRIMDYCNASLQAWIEYRFLKEDIIHTSITEAQQTAISDKASSLCQMFEKITEDYLRARFTNE